MDAMIGKPAPEFTLMGVVNGHFKEVSLSEFKGKKKVVIFFYPADFTFVCPTEILAFSDAIEEFWKRETTVLGISVDSIHSHFAWTRIHRKQGGISGITFPLLSDIKKETAIHYGALMEETGQAMRATYILNVKGILKHVTINHNDIGRNVPEVLRVLDAIDHSEKDHVVCPANWSEGQKAIQPTQEGLEHYCEQAHS